MSDLCTIDLFLDGAGPIFDVRAPCEYVQGHIPGSISLPLFSDEGRARVGTVYKHQGHDAAVVTGLEIIGPGLATMAQAIHHHMEGMGPHCRVTCFRGGMRSRSVQWLCQFLGYESVRLDGGYKAFRKHVLNTFEKPFSCIVLGGATGSGKTTSLRALRSLGYQVLDLEALANHLGSAFGLLPSVQQPSNEQFENLLASALWQYDASRPIIVEDESRMIGSCVIPKGVYEQMDRAPAVWLQVDVEERIQHIIDVYGSQPREWLVCCAHKLHKRLGGDRVHNVVAAIQEDRLVDAVRTLLDYYDQTYLYSRSRHPRTWLSTTRGQLVEAVASLHG